MDSTQGGQSCPFGAVGRDLRGASFYLCRRRGRRTIARLASGSAPGRLGLPPVPSVREMADRTPRRGVAINVP